MEILALKGMFICDQCRERLKINIDQRTFEEIKKQLNKKCGEDALRICYICRSQKFMKEGLMLNNEWIASSLEKVIESQEKKYKEFKEGIITCPNCGSRTKAESKHVICTNCRRDIDLKKYEKSIKMPATQKLTLRLYIKMLKKEDKR